MTETVAVPWHYDVYAKQVTVYTADHVKIAVIPFSAAGKAQAIANAMLICAAPTLLHCADAALAWCHKIGRDETEKNDLLHLHDLAVMGTHIAREARQ